ncbi:MAG TPA: outer membrane lipoprotein-sorting protein [Thermoanaerobaculia bacterium]|nr:outer membrane lipoprotein-sorting protein [Thermoanaerobaculia bacterium]
MQLRFGAGLLGTLLVAAGPAPAAEPTGAPRGEALVAAYNHRPFGNPGRRQVRLELRSGEQVTRTFVVSNLWRRQGEEVRTVFVLEEPVGLKGTNYLLVEDPGDSRGMQVFLHLPAGERRVLSVQPSRFDEGLLGSDFGYRDLRLQLPLAGVRYEVRGQERMLGRPVWVVEAIPEGEADRRSRYYLSEAPVLLLGVDHLRALPGGGRFEVVKRLRVEGLRQVDGAWTETRMVMQAPEGRSSVLTLEGFQPAYAVARRELFEPGALPGLFDAVARLAGASGQPGGSP